MNNLTVTNNQKISVQVVTLAQKGDMTGGSDVTHAGSKIDLIHKLGSTGGPSYANLYRPAISTVTTPYLIITSMFKMQGTTPAYF